MESCWQQDGRHGRVITPARKSQATSVFRDCPLPLLPLLTHVPHASIMLLLVARRVLTSIASLLGKLFGRASTLHSSHAPTPAPVGWAGCMHLDRSRYRPATPYRMTSVNVWLHLPPGETGPSGRGWSLPRASLLMHFVARPMAFSPKSILLTQTPANFQPSSIPYHAHGTENRFPGPAASHGNRQRIRESRSATG